MVCMSIYVPSYLSLFVCILLSFFLALSESVCLSLSDSLSLLMVFVQERDKLFLPRCIVLELIQALKFKMTLPDENLILLVQVTVDIVHAARLLDGLWETNNRFNTSFKFKNWKWCIEVCDKNDYL